MACAVSAMAACEPNQPNVAQTDDAGLPPSPFTEDAMRTAQIALRTKVCTALEQHDAVLFGVSYGSASRCIAAEASFEVLALEYGHGTAFTPDDMRACAAALDLGSREAYVRYRYERFVPEACRAMHFGTLAEGSACGAANQCASGICVTAFDLPSGSCGRCVTRRVIGESCVFNEECESGAACLGPSTLRTCRRLAEVGERCDSGTTCRHHLRCTSGVCALTDDSDNTCEPAFGCAAVPMYRHCSVATRTCVPAIAALDEACGWQPDRGIIRCREGATCTRARVITPGPVEATPSYQCKPRLALGSACNEVDHPFDSPCETGVCYQQRCQQNAAPQCTAPEVPP